MSTSIEQLAAADAFSQLVAAFRQHGTRWYEADDSYDLAVPAHVETFLYISLQFRCLSYTRDRARAKAAIVAQAAVDSGNRGWVGHPDNDPLDTLRAFAEITARLREVVEN